MIYLISNNKKIFEEVYTLSVCLDYFKSHKEIQLDTETTGLDCYINKLICIQLGDKINQYVIDLSSLTVNEFKELSAFIEKGDKLFILLNAKFDIKMLWGSGIFIKNNIYDVMLAEQILNMGKEVEKGFYGFAGIAKRYLNLDVDKSLRKNFQLNTAGVIYAAGDVQPLEEIKQMQMKKLIKLKLANKNTQDLTTVLGLENKAVFAYSMMEYCGMNLSLDKWKEVENMCYLNIIEAKKAIIDYIYSEEIFKEYRQINLDLFQNQERDLSINLASPKQKLDLLKKVIPDLKSTNELELAKYKKDHKIVKLLIEYSKANKLVTSFANTLPGFINEVSGKIHQDFIQILETGRVSSSKPNLQQIPSKTLIGKSMRESFVVGKNKLMVGGDFSQAELMLIAEVSQDPIWLEAFRNNKDLHTELACKTFKIDVSQVKEPTSFKKDIDYRSIQKTLNFGLAYGMSKFKLSNTIEVSEKTAQDIIDDFFKMVPKVKEHLDASGEFGKANGYIPTLAPYFRIRWFSKWSKNMDFKIAGEVERASKNTRIQGACADLTKLASIYLYDYIVENNYWHPKNVDKIKLIHQVHDEIQTEVDENLAEEWKITMNQLMLKAGEMIVKSFPMKVDCKISKCWSK